MEQCRTDPCVYQKIVEGVVQLILVVHVDDILVRGEKETCDELHHTLSEISRTKISGSRSGIRGALRSAIGKGEV